MKNIFKKLNFLNTFIVLLLSSIIFLFFYQQINLNSVDLGRHIKNGELVFSDSRVLFENFYSYTEPSHLFVNHHWLSGYIYYLTYNIGGFKLLSVLNITLALLIYLIIFKISVKRSNLFLAGIIFIPLSFLISRRVEIRPEMFSYLLIATTLYLLYAYQKSRNVKILYWFIPIFIFWINLHIYFILGLALLSFQLISDYFIFYKKSTTKKIFKNLFLFFKEYQKEIYLILLSILACLINPHFLKGLLYPLRIFQEYGYDVAENQTPFFISKISLDFGVIWWKVIIISTLLLLVIDYIKNRSLRIFDYLVFLLAIVVSSMAIRNFAIFAILIWPVLAKTIFDLKIELRLKKSFNLNKLGLYLLSLALIILFIFFYRDSSNNNFFIRNSLGLDITKSSEDSFSFFKNNNLKGPVFNNYDNGSALTFELFPEEKVFVDNRPEAYSVDFFKKIYIPMQEDESIWQRESVKYDFNVIFFAYTDSTSWAKTFLKNRINDPQWAVVYIDYSSIIMLKNNDYNEDIINQHSYDFWKMRTKLRELSKTKNNLLLMNVASLAELSGQIDVARNIYESILYRHYNNMTAIASLAHSYASSQSEDDLYESIYYFDKLEKEGYNFSKFLSSKALVYWKLTDYNQAIHLWKKSGNDETAKDYLQQAQELSIENPELFEGIDI